MKRSLPHTPNPPRSTPQRILIVGTTGAGKTTLARAIADATPLQHIELDALFWGPNWTPHPDSILIPRVQSAANQPQWVADGNFSKLRPILWKRADTILWLNTPPHRAFPQLLTRTIRRALSKEPLWTHNTESLSKSFLSRDSILWWYIQTYPNIQNVYSNPDTFKDYPHLQRITLHSRSQSKLFIEWLKREHTHHTP